MSKKKREKYYRESMISLDECLAALNRLRDEMADDDGMPCGGINQIISNAHKLRRELSYREDLAI